MKAASISEIKAALKQRSPEEVQELCLRLARHKKENKELLSYLLFEADDREAYVRAVKEEAALDFVAINTGNLFWAKKSLRKILRTLNKHIKFAGDKTVEVELLLHFCNLLKLSGIPYKKSPALLTLYKNQLKKVETIVAGLHEDLAHDYERLLDPLRE